MAEPTRSVELVAAGGPDRAERARVGIGLLVGLVVGRGSLMGAATGSEQFEVAIAHFVGIVLICVAGALVVGGVFDRAQIEADRRTTDPGDGEATPAPGIGITEGGEAGPTTDPTVGFRP